MQMPHGSPSAAGKAPVLCGASKCHLAALALAKDADRGVPVPRAGMQSLLSLMGTWHFSCCCCDSLKERWQQGQQMQTVLSWWRGSCQPRTAALLWQKVTLPSLRPPKEMPIGSTRVGNDTVNALQRKSLTGMEGCF